MELVTMLFVLAVVVIVAWSGVGVDGSRGVRGGTGVGREVGHDGAVYGPGGVRRVSGAGEPEDGHETIGP